MAIANRKLEVKVSSLPNAGMGLFTKVDFKKGDIITEYKGKLCTWKKVEDDVDNGYIYYMNDDCVIDARNSIKTFGRYANDAAGLQKVKGHTNNSIYVEQAPKVFIKATKNISAGSEIFVAYGKSYWDQVRKNIKVDAQKNTKKSI